MTLDQLEAFHAVAAHGTFSAASAALHKSQPAISKLVQNLEAELGLTLFDRSHYRAQLSDAGKLFFERTAQLLESAHALHGFGKALSGAGEPMLRLVLEAITPLPKVLSALRDVQALFPLVRYELRTERMTGAIEALQDGSADLVIASAHGLEASAFEMQPFADVRIIPVVSRGHALASVEGPVPGALLRKYAQVVLRDSARGELTQTMNVLSGGLRWTVTDVAAKLQIIDAGMGWGGLPEHVVAASLEAGTLRALAVREFHVDQISLMSMRRRGGRPGPVAQALWSRLARLHT